MKIFISWSGELSKKIAISIKTWLSQCIQSVEVFVSNDDIEKGDNWSVKLNDELAKTNYGIVCLTSENISAPWIHFEAGALSKLVDSRVSTVAVDVQFAEIKGPLSSFQNTKLEKDDMHRLLKSINKNIKDNGEKSLSEEILDSSFNAFWDTFDKEVKSHLEESKKTFSNKKTTQSKELQQKALEELLQLIRSQNSTLNDPARLLPPDYLSSIIESSTSYRDIDDRTMAIVYDYIHKVIEIFRFCTIKEKCNISSDFMMEIEKLIERLSMFDRKWAQRFRILREDIKMVSIENSFERKSIIKEKR